MIGKDRIKLVRQKIRYDYILIKFCNIFVDDAHKRMNFFSEKVLEYLHLNLNRIYQINLDINFI